MYRIKQQLHVHSWSLWFHYCGRNHNRFRADLKRANELKYQLGVIIRVPYNTAVLNYHDRRVHPNVVNPTVKKRACAPNLIWFVVIVENT